MPRCYLKASGAERPGHRGLLFWILAVSLPWNLRHNWVSSEGAPPGVRGGGGGGSVFLGYESQALSPGQVRYLQHAGLGAKPTTAQRHFTRPCTRGHTPLPSHMEMRYLCSYAAASKNGPTGGPSGCVSPSEFLKPQFYLRHFFY